MVKTARTDLAYERISANMTDGIDYQEKTMGVCKLHSLHIHTKEAERVCHIAKGRYHTLLLPAVTSLDESEREDILAQISLCLTDMAASLLGTSVMQGKRILVTGLGNRANTVDSLGPLIADRVHATAHLKDEHPDLLATLACAEIAIFSPGSTACIGMQSSALIAAAVQHFKPHLVIAADALAARSFSRLATTIQFTDAGISPGSGMGSSRARLHRAALGCPIIAIGVPTVTDTVTLIHDTFASAGIKPPRAWRKKAALTDKCFVCPPDSDQIIDRFADMIATAINRTFGVPDL
ncbi:MAG: GPR endopeptidase [Clostridia bacterium]|nr:GPR endopeptidase [Clostridia bacterium]